MTGYEMSASNAFSLLRSLHVKSTYTFHKNTEYNNTHFNISPYFRNRFKIYDHRSISSGEFTIDISYTPILDDYNRPSSMLDAGVFRQDQLVPYTEYSLLHL
jgi:hypothetical protein